MFFKNKCKNIELRPHHGMCLAYFEGKGYSEGFSSHMKHMLEILEKGTSVRLVLSGDAICKACPNLKNNICVTEECVKHYDQEVMNICGFYENQVMGSEEFFSGIEDKILEKGKRKEICSGCEWNYICENRISRWKKRSQQPD